MNLFKKQIADMRRLGLVFIFLAVSVASCRRQCHEQMINLSDTDCILLEADSLDFAEDLLAPRKVFAFGDGIAIFEPNDVEGFLHFYDKSGTLEWKYGTIGNAGNEYLSPNVFANGESLLILSMDGRYSEVKRAGSGIETGEFRSIGNKALSMGTNFLSLTAGGGTIVESPSSDDMLVFSGTDGGEFKYNEYPVDVPQKMHAYVKKNVIASCSYAISYALDTLFLAFKYYPVAAAVSVKDRHTTRMTLSVKENNEYKTKDGVPYYDDPILFYTYAASSGKNFYALFQNGTRSSIKGEGMSEIHVFSRDCKLKRRYVLDRRIYHFSVSEDGTEIYALGINKDYLAELYVYDIDS